MKTIWKVLIGLALVVPMVAYVAGSLVASAADDPAQRETIQIQRTEPTPTKTPSKSPSKSPSPSGSPSESGDDDDVEVITPDYDDFDDHDDHGDDDGEDHSGPGGGGDDHDDGDSGHGGED